MAAIDIRECTIRVWDGTPNTLLCGSVAAKSDLTFTSKGTHEGSVVPSITIVDPAGNTVPLSVAVVDKDITITLETDGSSVPVSTAAEVKTAVEALAAAHALVSVAVEDDGSGVVDAKAKASLAGANYIDIKIGEGNLTYSDKRPVRFMLNRGAIDTVRNDNEEPMELAIDAMWEYLTASTGGDPTFEDAVKKRGEASGWVTTAVDPCQPYCVDVELINNPNCANVNSEYILFPEFYYESVDHDLGDSSLSVSGRCNALEPIITRA